MENAKLGSGGSGILGKIGKSSLSKFGSAGSLKPQSDAAGSVSGKIGSFSELTGTGSTVPLAEVGGLEPHAHEAHTA